MNDWDSDELAPIVKIVIIFVILAVLIIGVYLLLLKPNAPFSLFPNATEPHMHP